MAPFINVRASPDSSEKMAMWLSEASAAGLRANTTSLRPDTADGQAAGIAALVNESHSAAHTRPSEIAPSFRPVFALVTEISVVSETQAAPRPTPSPATLWITAGLPPDVATRSSSEPEKNAIHLPSGEKKGA
jgi:hypothetical protein